jgi:hypothetical protein
MQDRIAELSTLAQMQIDACVDSSLMVCLKGFVQKLQADYDRGMRNECYRSINSETTGFLSV